jgi:hypothetical protein
MQQALRERDPDVLERLVASVKDLGRSRVADSRVRDTEH